LLCPEYASDLIFPYRPGSVCLITGAAIEMARKKCIENLIIRGEFDMFYQIILSQPFYCYKKDIKRK